MKYIISESRLNEFINSYLELFVYNKAVTHSDPWIIISQAAQGDDENWADYMEYDYTDGRLWINKSFLQIFTDSFGVDEQHTRQIISDWFSNKFDVEVKFTE